MVGKGVLRRYPKLRKRDGASSSKDPNVSVSSAWKPEEDAKLAEAINELGQGNWRRIASRIPGRSYKSCRAHWFSYLCHYVDLEGEDASDTVANLAGSSKDPDVRVSESGSSKGWGRGAWTSNEDAKLIRVIRELGIDNWNRIASRIPGRSYKSCRHRWYSYLRHHVKDDASEMTMIEEYDLWINDPNTPKDLKEFYTMRKDLYVARQGRTYSYHVLGYPLVEISKLVIDLRPFDFGPSQRQQPFRIYGHIILIDELGNEFLIFKKDQSDPLALTLECPPGNNVDALHLENFNFGCPRCLPVSFRVLVNLRDIHRKKFIVDKDIKVKFNDYNFPRDARSSLCQSPPISLEGNIYRSAVLACVGVSVVKGDNVDGDETEVNVGGSVLGVIQVTNSQIISRELFSNKSGEPHIINYGEDLVDLRITAMAVPSHSSLAIKLHLTVAGVEISDSVDFEVDDQGGLDEKVIAGKICNVVVSVQWYHPVRSLPEIISHQWCHKGESSEYASSSSSRAVDTSNNNNNNEIHFLSQSKYSKPFYIQPHLLDLKSEDWLVRYGRDGVCESLIEIFSISVCFFPVIGFSFNIHGAISGYINGQNRIDYFKLDEMKCSYEKGVGILHPHGPKSCHLSSRFAMSLDLKDADDREISFGYFAWDEFQHDFWMNQRMCSVIPGKHGYAAVHYMIIEDGLQAKLTCVLRASDGSRCAIRGAIYAKYSNFRYATDHDKAYYRSTLFQSDWKHVEDNGEVPLLKSVVAVPIISDLIVSVDIEVTTDTGLSVSFNCEELTFKPQQDKDSKGITVYHSDKKEVCAGYAYTKCTLTASVEWAGYSDEGYQLGWLI